MFQQLFTSMGSKLSYAYVLYMLFNVSCNHSLKKSQTEMKRVGNERKSLQLQEVFLSAAH